VEKKPAALLHIGHNDQDGFNTLERQKGLSVRSRLIQGITVLTVTLLAVVLVPFIGPIAVIMTPLPMIFCYFRLGRNQALAALVIAIGVVSVVLELLGRSASLPVLAMIGFTGILLAEILQRRYSLEKTFILASLALFFSGLGFILYYAAQARIEPSSLVEMYIAGILRENLKLYGQMNISEEQIRLVRDNSAEITRFFVGIFPALALVGAMTTVWFNLLAGRSLLRGSANGFPEFGDLTLWKTPDRLVWVLIAAGLMMLIPEDWLEMVVPGETLVIMGMNILIVCCLIYFFQGMAITAFFFRLKNISVIFRWLFYMLLAVQQYTIVFVIALGLFDLWIDFRKRLVKIKDVQA
jgi:uncharacterized protein YybS (DUF2232 family)